MVKIEYIQTKSALTPTGGFLSGFTHTFSPAIGCLLGKTTCGSFCYASFLQAHKIYGKGGWGDYLLVKENAPAILKKELDLSARRDPKHKHFISNLRVFSASSTEPLAGPLFNIYHECLQILAGYPIGRWVVQTRSPLVRNLKDEIILLKDRVIVSITIETDDDALFQIGEPGSPTIAARRAAVEQMQLFGVPIHVAVSPALPIRNITTFAHWLLQYADAVTVDTAVAGDGTGDGGRSEQSRLPELLMNRGVDWRDESQARALYNLLKSRAPDRVGWSSEGFRRLASENIMSYKKL